MNLSGVISSLDPSTLSYSRPVTGIGSDGRGLYTNGAATPVTGSWTPVTGKELAVLPEGRRDKEVRRLITATALVNGDLIVDSDDQVFEVFQASRWSTFSDILASLVVDDLQDSEVFIPGASRGRRWQITEVSAAYTVLYSDDAVYVDASAAIVPITLPDSASVVGQSFTIRSIDGSTFNVTLACAVLGQLINGSALVTINRANMSLRVLADGVGYGIV